MSLSAVLVFGGSALSGCALSGGGPGSQADGLQQVLDSGVLVAGTKYDAVVWGSVPQGKSEPEGFDIDVVHELARRLGVRAETKPVTSANRIANLTTSKVDILAASMVHTRERDKAIDFTVDYFEESMKLLVLDKSPYQRIEDLEGKKIVVAQGSIQETLVPRICSTCQVLSVSKWTDTMQSLLARQADAIFATRGTVEGSQEALAKSGTVTRVIGPDDLLPLPYSIGVRQGDSTLRDAINRELMAMQDDGTYARFVRKWWGDHDFALATWPEK
ncbi:transporter substrate-binding domain-containing protein [Prauserella cavernicola]|uniref:Transporter substrate-binding domain-containing protein n=1 Tax=Prauserella cavernicola TaxID=2800127 RepID=A0A934V2Y8_9PSEU|nr:transporter substrate-binding domain-containing protein [Prauserella cavernicola]MBK1786626.1 transporter substrate-binding domain-containing protein [Prauserella cavernicola]